VRGIPLGIERKISPFRDMACLFRLARAFQSSGFKAIQSVTPKAGLLAIDRCAVHARADPDPLVHWSSLGHTVWGHASPAKGVGSIDRYARNPSPSGQPLSAGFPGLRRYSTARQNACVGTRIHLRSQYGPLSPERHGRAEVRAELDLPEEALVFLFLGRCTFDKGLTDLARAFEALCAEREDTYLVIVGPDEEGLPRPCSGFAPAPWPGFGAWTTPMQPERLMASADVFCLPSYREGFGSVIIEAAAAGIPSIGSRIYGVTDAIQDGVTGLLHEPRNAEDLFAKMRLLAQDPGLRSSMGNRARARAEQNFSHEVVTAALLDYYECVLGPCLGRV